VCVFVFVWWWWGKAALAMFNVHTKFEESYSIGTVLMSAV
jgi:hypothetical protein